MSHPHFCPHCGFNLKTDLTVKIGNWSLSADCVTYNGQTVKMTTAQNLILHAIALSYPRVASKQAILGRSSYSDNPNILSVQICRLRKQLGPICPIETVRGRGFRWKVPANAENRPSLRDRNGQEAAVCPIPQAAASTVPEISHTPALPETGA